MKCQKICTAFSSLSIKEVCLHPVLEHVPDNIGEDKTDGGAMDIDSVEKYD